MGTDNNDGNFDEQLSRAEAATYAEKWAQETLEERESEAWDHYQRGVDAIDTDNYAKAIYELERAVKLYEEIHSDVFEMRNRFEPGQPRRELFDVLWRVYYHIHEAAAAWSNSAFATQDDSDRAAEWRADAIEAYHESSKYTSTWEQLLSDWSRRPGLDQK